MERVRFGMWMEMCLRDIGKMIRLMGMGFIDTQMGLNMRDIGRMIYSTGMD